MDDKTVSVHDVVLESAEAGLGILESAGGHMPAGHNGPWNDAVTPLRNTGHWLITFLKAYEISADQRFRDAASTCADYILDDERRPHGFTFKHRDTPRTDRCNGLIGQAWTLEALSYAHDMLSMDEARELAEQVFLMHPFDEKRGLWHCVDVDGTDMGVHPTFNQQLWMAVAGSLVSDAPEVSERVERFINRFPDNVRMYSNGLIYHEGYPYSTLGYVVGRLRSVLNGDFRRKYALAVGYHSFNLYGLAVLKEAFGEHELWGSDIIDEVFDAVESVWYKNNVSDNVYSFGYNPTGIEIAFAQHVFDRGTPSFWLDEQFRRCYDNQSGTMSNGWDERTLAARIYELTRLPILDIEIGGKTD